MATSAENDNGDSARMRAERNVLRALVQYPLDAWAQCCMLREADFQHYAKVFTMVRALITSYLKDDRSPIINEQVLTLEAEHFGVNPADIGALFEVAHHSKFTEGLNAVRQRPASLDELTRQGRVAAHCQRIAERQIGLIVETTDTRAQIKLLHMAYRIPESTIRQSGLPLAEVESRLVDAQCDTLEECRPEHYDRGWHSACDDVELMDDLYSSDTDDSDLYTIRDLQIESSTQARTLRTQRQQAFLKNDQSAWSETQRCELWYFTGRIDCFSVACDLSDEMGIETSFTELATILRTHDSISGVHAFIASHKEQQILIDADARLARQSGIHLLFVQERQR